MLVYDWRYFGKEKLENVGKRRRDRNSTYSGALFVDIKKSRFSDMSILFFVEIAVLYENETFGHPFYDIVSLNDH